MSTLQIGDVIDVVEQDYKHGTGRLILRVTGIGSRYSTADGDWLELDGLELRPDGTPLGAEPRYVAIRLHVAAQNPLP